jgi:hypothetical protein
MSTSIAASRTEPGSGSPVKAVSVISTGTVQIRPEHPYGSRKPLYWWLLTSRQWTPPRLERIGASKVSSAVRGNLAKLKELPETGRVRLQDGRAGTVSSQGRITS